MSKAKKYKKCPKCGGNKWSIDLVGLGEMYTCLVCRTYAGWAGLLDLDALNIIQVRDYNATPVTTEPYYGQVRPTVSIPDGMEEVL